MAVAIFEKLCQACVLIVTGRMAVFPYGTMATGGRNNKRNIHIARRLLALKSWRRHLALLKTLVASNGGAFRHFVKA